MCDDSSSTNAVPAASMRRTRPGDDVPTSSPPRPSATQRHDVRRLRLEEDAPAAVGVHLVDAPLLARADEERAVGRRGEAPDVFVVGIEEGALPSHRPRRGTPCRPETKPRRRRRKAPARAREHRARPRRTGRWPCRRRPPSTPCRRCRCAAQSVSRSPASSRHTAGEATSCTSSTAGPSVTRPSLSIERLFGVALQELGLGRYQPEARAGRVESAGDGDCQRDEAGHGHERPVRQEHAINGTGHTQTSSWRGDDRVSNQTSAGDVDQRSRSGTASVR